ncbi:MAG: hypothetical protein ACXWP1_06970 [Bdellovibrionota bacterium]
MNAVRAQKFLWITAAMALFVAMAMPRLFLTINELGHNIPSPGHGDHVVDYLKGWAAALFFMGVILVSPLDSEDKKNLRLLWLAKVAVMLVFMLFYEANYGLDAYWYFERSQDKFPDLSDVGFGNGTANMQALAWAFEHYVIGTASFHAQKVICGFVSTLGLFCFFSGLRSYRPGIPSRLFLILGLFPSILFWSSTLGKDAWNLLGISLTFYGMMRMIERRSLIYLLPTAAGLTVVAALRLWLIPILVIPFVLASLFHFKNILIRAFVIATVFGAVAYELPKMSKQLSIESTDQLASRVGKISRSWQRGGSAGDVPIITTPGDALKFLPIGMFTALFRPLPGEIMNPFGLLAGLENLLLLFLLFRAIKAWSRDVWKDELLVWLVAYVLLWSMLYAFISPQNLGAAVRFRVQCLPELLVLLVYVAFIKQQSSPGAEEE